MKSIDRVDKTFFDSITGMFTEKQQRELIRIRNERSLAAYRILVLEMLSDMNNSARPNMTELVRFALDEESEETKQREVGTQKKFDRYYRGGNNTNNLPSIRIDYSLLGEQLQR